MTSRKNTFHQFTVRYVLPLVDYLLLWLCLFLYLKIFNPYTTHYKFGLVRFGVYLVILFGVWAGYSYVFNLNKVSQSGRVRLMIVSVMSVSFFTALSYFFIPFISPDFPKTRQPAFLFVICMLLFPLIWRLVYAWLFSFPILEKRVLIVGGGIKATEFTALFLENKLIYNRNRLRILGYIDDAIEKNTTVYKNLKVIGGHDLLLKYARRLKADTVILAVRSKESIEANLYNELLNCKATGIEIIYANDLLEEETGMIQVMKRDDKFYLSYDYITGQASRLYLLITAVMNFTIGAIGTIIFIAFIPLVWLLNFAGNKGPLFYSQKRVGLHGKEFTITKFRSMVPDAEKHSGAVWASQNDTRITPLGKFYRKTRIDELPQFLSVFRGEMYIIGPRPERQVFVDKLSHTIPFFNMRHLAKPGITGWSQVNMRYANDETASLEKLKYDLYYIKYRSFFLDLQIVLKTIGVMLKFKGN